MRGYPIIFTVLFTIISICSCTESNNKDIYISNFEKFIVRVERDSVYDSEKKAEFKELYNHYSKDTYEIHKSKLTSEDKESIGKFKARYVKAITAKEIKNAVDPLNDFIDEASGFIKGLIDTDDE